MELVDYLAKRKVTIPQAAAEIGCARNTLWRIAKRLRRPRPDLTDRIIAWSEGKVTLAELMALDPDRPRP